MKIISNKIIKGLTVEVKYDNVEKALRKLKKSIDDDGRLDRVKERKHYQKPSVTKRLAKKSSGIAPEAQYRIPQKIILIEGKTWLQIHNFPLESKLIMMLSYKTTTS